MTEYFYIPKKHEQLVKQVFDYWTNEKKGWTILKGVYKDAKNPKTTNTILYNVNVLREKEYITNGFKNEKISKSLIGYCLEGDLGKFVPEFRTQLLELDKVLVFSTNEKYLEYERTI